ncbi:hypothetical protein HDV03_004429 [Kappamyces sp. JEL0829]|nr:hypothetical protein HDV03_004429 [Kappamyces sp. JEL0829]
MKRERNTTPCEQCKIRRKKCDGQRPSCGTCSKAKRQLGPCYYDEAPIPNVSLEGLVDTFEGISLAQVVEKHVSQGLQLRRNHEMPSQERLAPLEVPALPSHHRIQITDNIRQHLLSWAALNDDYTRIIAGILQVSETHRDGYQYSQDLVDSLCFYGCLYTKNPMIFPNANDITLMDRLKFAQLHFSMQGLIDTVSRDFYDSLYHVYDTISALLVRGSIASLVSSNINTGLDPVKCCFRLVKKFQLLHPLTFAESLPNVLTGDDIAIIKAFYNWPTFQQPATMSMEERMERLEIIHQLLQIDTLIGDVLGGHFQMDDLEIPIPHNLPSLMIQMPRTPPSDSSEVSSDSSSSQFVAVDITEETVFRLGMAKLYRKVTNFKKLVRYSACVPITSHQSALHYEMLNHWKPKGQKFLLEPFTAVNGSIPPKTTFPFRHLGSDWYATIEFLSHLCTLHFATFTYQETKFALAVDGSQQFTSRQIIFAAVRALGFVISNLLEVYPGYAFDPNLEKFNDGLGFLLNICKCGIVCYNLVGPCNEYEILAGVLKQQVDPFVNQICTIWPGFATTRISLNQIYNSSVIATLSAPH